MWKREAAVAALAMLAACAAAAQTAKTDAAADAAAMERAKRQAAGPMRVILEASKARRKNTEAEAAPAPAAANTRGIPQRVAGAADASDAAVAASPTPVAPAAAAPSAVSAAASAPVPSPSSGVVTQITLSSAALENRAPVAPVPALESAGAAARVSPLALPAAPAAQLPTLTVNAPAADVRPRISRMVEPEVPQRVLQDIAVNTAVIVDLSLRADGTVAAVNVVPPVPRQLVRIIAAALEQWRFEPLPAARVHRIELVFNADR